MEMKTPLYENGELVCPHCKTPLILDEENPRDNIVEGIFVCSFCKGLVGRLSDEVMIKMIDDFPKEVLREWMLEMKQV